jgi:arylsulfatase A-like enzyme
MRRRTFVGFGLAAPTLGWQRAVAQKRDRMNLLFVMTDQQRGDCLGADGNKAILTPNLDRLASEGVRFRRAYSSTPTCTPARAALLTGLSPWNHGMLGYHEIPQRYEYEKPRALRELGYSTTSIGKNHFSPWRNSHGYEQMFLDEHSAGGLVHEKEAMARRATEERTDYEAWFYSQEPNRNPYETGLGWNDYAARPFALPERLHPTTWTGDMAVRYLETYKDPRPFYLKVSFIRPHSPYDPPERFWKMYADRDMPKAVVARWANRFEKPSSERPDIWHGKLKPETIANSRRGYYASITHVDEQIGRIVETLEKQKKLDETLIVFTSDHGDMTGDHNLWRKSYAYEASARIPMIVRMPGASKGQVLNQPVELRDIFPTLLDAAGASPSRQLDGDSMLKLVRDPKARWREVIDLEHNVCYSPVNNWNALTDGRMKYIFHAQDGAEQLFDLHLDPNELNDLSGYPEKGSELRLWRQKMLLHFEQRGEPFIANGRLGLRPKGVATSPNFPRKG